MTASSHTLGVVATISELGPAELGRVLRERDVIAPADASVVDLAQALSEPQAVWAQLRLLTGTELHSLDQLAEGNPVDSGGLPEDPHSRLLTTNGRSPGRLRDEVAEVWPEVRDQLRSAGHSDSALGWSAGGQEIDIHEVLVTLETIEHILHSVHRQPLDAATLPGDDVWESRMEGAEGSERDWQHAAILAWRAGLITHSQRRWIITRDGVDFLHSPLALRAATLARAIWSQLPPWLASLLEVEPGATHFSPADYPLVDAADRAHWLRLLTMTGLASAKGPSLMARALASGADGVDVIGDALPETSSQLYADGPDSVVAAGVLEPEREVMLRRIGRWDSGGLAPRFVLSPASVLRAVQSGVDPESIRQFVHDAIPGGEASALGHLIDETLTKADLISLTPDLKGATLQAADEITATLLRSDRRLGSLGFQREGELGLHSDMPVEHIHELLIAEGYPHLVRDAEGHLMALGSGPVVDAAAMGASWSDQDVEALLRHWRDVREAAPAQWIEPMIELAMAAGVSVTVDVDMGDRVATMQLELRSVGNGRLRARDIRSDVERTIPVNRIVSISPGVASSDQS